MKSPLKMRQPFTNLRDSCKAFVSKTEKKFSNYEHVYETSKIEDLTERDLTILPLYVNTGNARVLITEADLYDYPAMFLKGNRGNELIGWYPNYPSKTIPSKKSWLSDRRIDIIEEADYIAVTKGERTFPWRVFTIAENDKEIANSELVYLLSRPSSYKSFNWIKPGQTSWEWWHASNIIGVDF